jgi:hypothetical protein
LLGSISGTILVPLVPIPTYGCTTSPAAVEKPPGFMPTDDEGIAEAGWLTGRAVQPI